MKITPLRLAAVGILAAAMTFVGSNQASAAVYVGVNVGVPPPPPPVRVDSPWARPYPGAVWIAPHNEWINGRWVWVRGYYGYPPRRGAYWVAPRYRHGRYYPGRWAY